MKWKIVAEEEGARVYRACPFCGRRLVWRYDLHRDFTIGTPRCLAHGDLDTWATRTADKMLGAGRLTEAGVVCGDGDDIEPFTVEYDSHRFKAVAPKRNLREPGGLLDLMEVQHDE